MKYRIFDTVDGEYLNDSNIVTQEGKVASWDEGQGWEEYPEDWQKRFRIEVKEP